MITHLPSSARTLGSRVAIWVMAARSVKVPSAQSNRWVRWTVTESGPSGGSRSRLEFRKVPDSAIAPVVLKLPGKGPNGFRVSIVTVPAFGMAARRRAILS